MRRACATDRNQPEIVEALRDAGCTVQILAAVGKGCPDLLVGFDSHHPIYGSLNLLMEIKDGLARKSDRKLTPDQIRWHHDWVGHKAYVVESKEQALDVLKMFQ